MPRTVCPILALAVASLPVHAPAETIDNSAGPVDMEEIVTGLDHPWSDTFRDRFYRIREVKTETVRLLAFGDPQFPRVYPAR